MSNSPPRLLALTCAFAALTLSGCLALAGTAYGNDSITKADDIPRFALPVAAGATAYLLNHVTHEEGPNGADDHSLPSDSAVNAFAGVNYLRSRYGFEYGAPANAAVLFVGDSRVRTKEHHWCDVAASESLSLRFNNFIVTRYRHGVRYDRFAAPMDDGASLRFSMRFWPRCA